MNLYEQLSKHSLRDKITSKENFFTQALGYILCKYPEITRDTVRHLSGGRVSGKSFLIETQYKSADCIIDLRITDHTNSPSSTLLIEIKWDSCEGDGQIDRYLDLAEGYVVYLTKNPERIAGHKSKFWVGHHYLSEIHAILLRHRVKSDPVLEDFIAYMEDNGMNSKALIQPGALFNEMSHHYRMDELVRDYLEILRSFLHKHGYVTSPVEARSDMYYFHFFPESRKAMFSRSRKYPGVGFYVYNKYVMDDEYDSQYKDDVYFYVNVWTDKRDFVEGNKRNVRVGKSILQRDSDEYTIDAPLSEFLGGAKRREDQIEKLQSFISKCIPILKKELAHHNLKL